VNLGLDINNATNTFNGASGALIIGGGVTNTANLTTLTLAGTGILTNILGSAGPGSMTNTILVNSTNANWTLMDNPSASAMTVPWVFNIASGTFNFGGAGSAPALTNTTVNGAPQDFVVGAVVGSVGTFNMSNGVLTTVARLDTGTAGGATGIVNQVGGTLTIGSQVQGANGGTNAVSLFNVSGGLLNVYDTQARTFYVASRGLGTLTVSGSGTVQCGTLDLSRGVSGTLTKGVVNLNGGTLQVNNVTDSSTTANSTAAFNFNGGTLKPNGNSATFYQGGGTIPLTTTVQVGGAIINDAGYAITVAEPLLHDSTLGVTPDGGLLKLGAGTLTLTAASTYTGNTLVSNGTLVVSGSLGHTLVTVATNATLAGTGSLGSNVMVNAGGTLFPASPGVTGTLTVAGNITFQSGSTSGMQLSKGSSLSNSVLASTAGTMTYGGILSVTNLGAALAAGDHFKLFNAGSYGGTFAATNLPALGTGLGWSWDPASGMLSVIQTVNVAPTNLMTTVVGNQLTLSWPADHIGWQLQMQTDDLSAGLGTNWVNVPGSSTNNRVSVTINPANGAVFYRMVYP
jgi:autotransporter-associated beta strand protein